MAVSLPRLAQLLAKAGMGGAPAEGGADKSPLAADKSGLVKGQVLDADGKVIVGLGYNPADRAKAQQNLHEKSSIDAFVKALKGEAAEPTAEAKATGQEPDKADKPDKPKAKGEEGGRPAAEDGPARKEGRELREDRQQDIRREERQEDARALGQKEAKEQAETREAKEPVERRVEREKQDDEKHGHGYVFSDPEAEEEEQASGYRSSEVFSDSERCHGVIEDGTRCVRRARDGRPFCRAHLHASPE